MQKKNILLVSLVVLLVGFVLIATVSGLFTPASKQTVTKIGIIMPLSGDAAGLGDELSKSLELAKSEINKDQNKIEFIYEDGKCDSKEAANAASKLVNIDKVDYIIGGFCSSEVLGAAPIIESSKVIMLSPSGSSQEITNAGDYVFRLIPSDSYLAQKVSEEMVNQKITKVAIIYENEAYSKALADTFKAEYLKDSNNKIVLEEGYMSTENDFRTIVTKVIASNPQAVYLIPNSTGKATLRLILNEFQANNYKPKIFTNEMIALPEIVSEYPELVEGAIYPQYNINDKDPVTLEYSNKLKSLYGQDFPNQLPLSYSAYTYDSVYVIAEAIDHCKEDTECAKAYLYSIKDKHMTSGTVTFDSYGDVQSSYIFNTIRNGTVVIYN
ncbi:MAG: penicillin-binding protein activator [archaeon]|jgi:branched-chain amino acid transport system substrate-binding protein